MDTSCSVQTATKGDTETEGSAPTKERPILFSGAMVTAILDGRKTQTRRVVKPQPGPEWRLHKRAPATFVMPGSGSDTHSPLLMSPRCPYGQPGDRLWVREAHCAFEVGRVHYRADYALNPKGEKEHGIVWTPSIHMPRWASRILLEITAVRVERLNEISEDDARAEGCYWSNGNPECGIPTEMLVHAKDEYRHLWEQINGAGSWAANPWVWVVEFRRLQT